jgi:hypothetical protein
MLIAILIFILAAVFIVSLVTNALDKPKEAGIMNDFNHYEDSAELLLRSAKDNTTPTALAEEFNKGIDEQAKFEGTKSKKKNAYNKPYDFQIVESATPKQTAIVVDTIGKSTKKPYRIVIVKEGKTVESCTFGFGRKDKKLATLTSELCNGPTEVVTVPDGGGTVEPPFVPVTVAPDGCTEIRTAAQLDAIRNDMTDCYVVMNPIDLSGYANWMPLGVPDDMWASVVSFTGSFDGQRYPITGLKVDRPTTQYAALFGRARTATFENVKLDNVSISGEDNSAGLVGYADTNTVIDSSSVSGSVTGPTYTALLAGELDESTVTNSHTSGTVTGDYGTGGLVGEIYGTSVSDSYSTATVKGNQNVGGLIAASYNWGTPGDITNSYATGSVEGLTEGMYIGGLVGLTQTGINLTNTYATGDVSNGQFAGGLIGALDGGNGDTVSKSYATGDVIGLSSGDAGGLIGNAGGATIVDSYSLGNVSTPVLTDAVNDKPHTGGFIGYVEYDVAINNTFSAGTATGVGTLGGFIGLLETSVLPTNSYFNSDGNVADIYGAIPKTSAQLKQQATFAGFDFTSTWKSDGSNYPTLK